MERKCCSLQFIIVYTVAVRNDIRSVKIVKLSELLLHQIFIILTFSPNSKAKEGEKIAQTQTLESIHSFHSLDRYNDEKKASANRLNFFCCIFSKLLCIHSFSLRIPRFTGHFTCRPIELCQQQKVNCLLRSRIFYRKNILYNIVFFYSQSYGDTFMCITIPALPKHENAKCL